MFDQIVYEYEADMTRYENENMYVEICWESDRDNSSGQVWLNNVFSHNAF